MKQFCFAKTVVCCNRNVILSSEHVTKMCTCNLSAVGFYTLTHFALQEQLVGLWKRSECFDLCCCAQF
jgi:hypothetical protein